MKESSALVESSLMVWSMAAGTQQCSSKMLEKVRVHGKLQDSHTLGTDALVLLKLLWQGTDR